MTTKTATKYATPEQIAECWMIAKRNSRAYIDNDAAREYVATHHELCRTIAQAQAWMCKARYELELSNLLDEDGSGPHYDNAWSYPTKAKQLADEAAQMLDEAEDIDTSTYLWLRYYYLHYLPSMFA